MANNSRNTGLPSGFSDTLPAEKILFDRLTETIQTVIQSYGFSPIDTPVVEWMDTLKGHDDSGSKLIYRVLNGYEVPTSAEALDKALDKGLRFDLTVPLARFVSDHSGEIRFPFRRYHLGSVFRGETAQTGKGRYRQFSQFDFDAVGARGFLAEVETAAILADVMSSLELPALIKINNRQLLDGLVELGGVTAPDTKTAVFTAIDKIDKIGKDQVLTEISQLTNPEFVRLVESFLSVTGSNEEKINQLATLLQESAVAQLGIENLRSVVSALSAAGYKESIVVSPEIVRGLGYYTGVIFETFVSGMEKFGSVASGGRYDHLVHDLGGPDLPAVGASFGVSRLLDVLRESGWTSTAQTTATVLVVNFTPELTAEYFSLATELRKNGIATQLFSESKKVGEQLKYASDIGIPFGLILGEDEKAKGTVIIRNLETREQEEVMREELVGKLKSLL